MFYDADDRPWFRLDEQRQDVPFDQISTYFKDAVIAVEDHRYYLHPGIDPIGLTRAVFYNINGTTRQGGSTITQQLARTLFLSNSKTYGRKAQGSRPVGDAGDLPLEAGDSPALHEPHLPRRRDLRRRGDVAADVWEAGVRSHAWRGRADRRHHSRTRVVFAVESTRARTRQKLHRAAAACARKGRSPPRRKKRRGARRCAFDQPHRRRTAAIGYAKEFLRQQFRDIYRRRQPARLEGPDDVRARGAGCGGSRRAQRAASPQCSGSAGGARRDRPAARATCWRSSADRTFKRRRSIARHAAIASLDRRSSRSSTRRRSSRGSRRCQCSAACSRWRCRRPKASGFRATIAQRRTTR